MVPPTTIPAASATLAAEVKKKVRESGLVVWLDAERRYGSLVQALDRHDHDFPYPVVSYGGSYLELMLALEPYGSGLDKDHVLIHLPGLNKETVKETPVFELYEAGTVFEKALPTVVREASVGIARPEEVDAFLKGGAPTLESADAWLAGLRSAPRDRVTLLLESLGVDDVVLGVLAEDARFREHLPGETAKIAAFLEKSLGLDGRWRTFLGKEGDLSSSAMATLVASWIMAVEFVHDLKEDAFTPELRDLAKLGAPLVKEVRRLAVKLRERHPDLYEGYATELQQRLEDERRHDASALGAIDTFRFEESKMRDAAVAALRAGEWSTAAAIASARTTEQCFWVRRSPALQRTWDVLRLAAATGEALLGSRRALSGCQSVDEAVPRYVDKLAPVDRLHRTFEQRAHAVLSPDLEDYDVLLQVRRAVRVAYREWADVTNRQFFELCSKYGPLPSRSLRQRSIFDDEVKPLVEQGDRVAYFLVDALRFEMAQGLAVELEKERIHAVVRGRLAELPTDTVVGMNALAPVERNGRLTLVQKNGAPAGFSTGEFIVAQPKDRVKAISQRVLGSLALDIELETFSELDLPHLKKLLQGKPSLVVVRSRELDTAGEHNLHLGTFDQTLSLLKNAISLLSQAGIERFVVSADHGFLLQDPTVEGVPFGADKRVAQRRHALLDAPSGMADVLELPFSALEYDVEKEGYLVFRADTAPWKVSEKVAPFVHGGNSLQERVIPVMVLERQVARGKTLTKYEVVARPEPAHLGRQRLRVAIRLQDRANATLGFVAPKTIDLALRVKSDGLARSDIALVIVDASPPASLVDGQVLVPPNREEAIIEFELEGMFDEKVRIEVFHPGAREEVTPKVVEGFFDVWRDRRRAPTGAARTPEAPPAVDQATGAQQAARPASEPPPPSRRTPETRPPLPRAADPSWKDLIEDPSVRRIFELLADHQIVNEVDLQQILGSARRVRAFSRELEALVQRVPFEVEVGMTNGLKTYQRKD